MLVEDEIGLSDALVQILAKNKYMTDACYDGVSGLDNALTGIHDVIILDIMLPGMNGLEVLREIRRNKLETPVILLTAKDEISDKVTGLDYGADDYITKPFSTEELLARIRSISRRNQHMVVENALTFSDITLNLSTYELFCGEKSIKLGLKEFYMMELLLRNGSIVLSKETLIEKSGAMNLMRNTTMWRYTYPFCARSSRILNPLFPSRRCVVWDTAWKANSTDGAMPFFCTVPGKDNSFGCGDCCDPETETALCVCKHVHSDLPDAWHSDCGVYYDVSFGGAGI